MYKQYPSALRLARECSSIFGKIRIYTYIHIYIYVYTYVYICTKNIHQRWHLLANARVSSARYTYTHTYIYVYTYVCTCINILHRRSHVARDCSSIFIYIYIICTITCINSIHRRLHLARECWSILPTRFMWGAESRCRAIRKNSALFSLPGPALILALSPLVCVRERESACCGCGCGCGCWREREREKERRSAHVCMCVCERERDREKEVGIFCVSDGGRQCVLWMKCGSVRKRETLCERNKEGLIERHAHARSWH